jgi:hypothetical protein
LNEAGALQCRRCGRFLPGNTSGYRHGLSAYQRTRALPPDLRVSVEEFRESLISAQGGLTTLDEEPVRAGLVRLLVDCETGRRLLMNEVVRRGIDSKAGGRAYDRLLATMDRWDRVASKLGIARRSRPVVNGMDYMRQL